MTRTYLVATGATDPFRIPARNPQHAIELLKQQISERRDHDRIGVSLVEALSEGRLNFIVFDADRTKILAGELAGQFQQPPSRELVQSMLRFVPPLIAHHHACSS
jgi:hypothetical protein